MSELTKNSTDDEITDEIIRRLKAEGYEFEDDFQNSVWYCTLFQKIKECLATKEGDPK